MSNPNIVASQIDWVLFSRPVFSPFFRTINCVRHVSLLHPLLPLCLAHKTLSIKLITKIVDSHSNPSTEWKIRFPFVLLEIRRIQCRANELHWKYCRRKWDKANSAITDDKLFLNECNKYLWSWCGKHINYPLFSSRLFFILFFLLAFSAPLSLSLSIRSHFICFFSIFSSTVPFVYIEQCSFIHNCLLPLDVLCIQTCVFLFVLFSSSIHCNAMALIHFAIAMKISKEWYQVVVPFSHSIPVPFDVLFMQHIQFR